MTTAGRTATKVDSDRALIGARWLQTPAKPTGAYLVPRAGHFSMLANPARVAEPILRLGTVESLAARPLPHVHVEVTACDLTCDLLTINVRRVDP
jgi:hypothetical protein